MIRDKAGQENKDVRSLAKLLDRLMSQTQHRGESLPSRKRLKLEAAGQRLIKEIIKAEPSPDELLKILEAFRSWTHYRPMEVAVDVLRAVPAKCGAMIQVFLNVVQRHGLRYIYAQGMLHKRLKAIRSKEELHPDSKAVELVTRLRAYEKFLQDCLRDCNILHNDHAALQIAPKLIELIGLSSLELNRDDLKDAQQSRNFGSRLEAPYTTLLRALQRHEALWQVAEPLLRTTLGKWIYTGFLILGREDPSYEIALAILSQPLSLEFPQRHIKLDANARAVAPIITTCFSELNKVGSDTGTQSDIFSVGVDILKALAASEFGYDATTLTPKVQILVDQGSESLTQAFAALFSNPSVRKKLKKWRIDLRPVFNNSQK